MSFPWELGQAGDFSRPEEDMYPDASIRGPSGLDLSPSLFRNDASSPRMIPREDHEPPASLWSGPLEQRHTVFDYDPGPPSISPGAFNPSGLYISQHRTAQATDDLPPSLTFSAGTPFSDYGTPGNPIPPASDSNADPTIEEYPGEDPLSDPLAIEIAAALANRYRKPRAPPNAWRARSSKLGRRESPTAKRVASPGKTALRVPSLLGPPSSTEKEEVGKERGTTPELHACANCPKTFRRADHLERHVQTLHTETSDHPAKADGKDQSDQVEKKFLQEMRARLKASGFSDGEISVIIDKETAKKNQIAIERAYQPHVSEGATKKLLFPRISREFIEIETLRHFGLPWEYSSNDRAFIVILRDLDKEEVEILIEHSQKIRNERALIEVHFSREERPNLSAKIKAPGPFMRDQSITFRNATKIAVAQPLSLISLQWSPSLQASYSKDIAASLDSGCLSALERALIRDLAWVPPARVEICVHEQLQISDRLKIGIEVMTGSAWDWWPLPPPRRPIPKGCHRLRWGTPNGHPRSLDVPEQKSRAFRDAMAKAPAFLSRIDTPQSKPMEVGDHRQRHDGPQGNTAHPSGDAMSRSNTQLSQSSEIAGSSASQGGQQSHDQRNLGTRALERAFSATEGQPQTSITMHEIPAPRYRHVYLCQSNSTMKHRLIEIGHSELETDQGFFLALRREYITSKGFLSRCLGWASWWRYDHCEFWKFQKYPISRSASSTAPIGVSYPLESDPDYDFTPKPVELAPPEGPITKLEFNERFYSCCTRSQRWEWEQRRTLLVHAPAAADTDAVKALPKRTAALEMQDGKREVFWGLLIREKRSDFMVLIYVVLFNIPGLLFFFLWLFPWGHSSDLQNASVPSLTTLSLTVGLVGWLYHSPGHNVR